MKLSHPRGHGLAALLAASCCAIVVGFAGHARASTWRCGNTYSDQPCDGGMRVDSDDPRSASQKQDADATTRSAHTAAERMERERARLEAGRRQAVLIDNRPQPRSAPAPAAGKAKKATGKAGDHFSAHDPVGTARIKAAKAGKTGKPGQAKKS